MLAVRFNGMLWLSKLWFGSGAFPSPRAQGDGRTPSAGSAFRWLSFGNGALENTSQEHRLILTH